MQSPMVKYVEGFLADGMVLAPFLSDDLVPAIVSGFEKIILGLPEEELALWEVHRLKDEKPDDGFIRKNGEVLPDGRWFDRKWYFHYREFLPGELERRGVNIRPHDDFLTACAKLHSRCLRFSMDFVAELDRQLPGFNFAELVRQADEEHVLRVLRYDLVEPGQLVMAQGHVDKAGWTIAPFESRRGLWMGTEAEQCVVPKHTALVFGGVRAEDISRGKIKAPRHGVIESDPEAKGNRWSIVFFLQTATPLPASYKEK